MSSVDYGKPGLQDDDEDVDVDQLYEMQFGANSNPGMRSDDDDDEDDDDRLFYSSGDDSHSHGAGSQDSESSRSHGSTLQSCPLASRGANMLWRTPPQGDKVTPQGDKATPAHVFKVTKQGDGRPPSATTTSLLGARMC